MSEHENGEPWIINPKVWDAAAVVQPFDVADLGPHIEAVNDAVRDLVYRYEPVPALPPLEEGVTVGHQVLWSGRPGPGMVRPVAMLVDEDGNAVVEPTGDWQHTTIVDDGDTL